MRVVAEVVVAKAGTGRRQAYRRGNRHRRRGSIGPTAPPSLHGTTRHRRVMEVGWRAVVVRGWAAMAAAEGVEAERAVVVAASVEAATAEVAKVAVRRAAVVRDRAAMVEAVEEVEGRERGR